MPLDTLWNRMSRWAGRFFASDPPLWRRQSALPAAAAVLVVLAVPLLCDLVFTVSGNQELQTSVRNWTMAYGQLRDWTQQSRRRSLYALLGTNSDCLPSIRQADQGVSLTVGEALMLGPDAGANAVIRQFSARWKDYARVRDGELALLTQGRSDDAVRMETESGAPAFEKAQAALAQAGPLVDAYLSRRERMELWAFAGACIGLAILLIGMVCFIAVFVWMDRKRRVLLESLEENNETLRAEKEAEHQYNRILELIGSKEPLETVLDAVVAALHRQQPDPATGCAVLALHGAHLRALTRGLSPDLVEAAKRFAAKVAAGEPVDTGKEELREAALQDGFVECRFAPVWVRGTEDGGWIVTCHKLSPVHGRTASVLMHRAQRAAVLAIENRRLYEHLAQQAHFDALTQLPNRLLFHDRLHQAMAHARRHRTKVAILWLDLDGFKRVNDTLGHRAGDTLLRLAGQRLLACVRETDTLARLGGDEFTVVLKEVRDLASAMLAAEKLLEALRRPFQIARHDLSISASIGVSIFPDHGEDVTAVVKSADIAMYRAKTLGKSRVEAFMPSMADAERERLEMEIQLRAAIGNEEFELYYQPQVDLQGGLVGLEALVRWNHNAKGVISPGDFIPVAEADGLIVPLGAWVLRRACLQCREWMDRGFAVPSVAVNVSAVQLADSDFAALLKRCLTEARLEPKQLELEITETSFLDNAVETGRQIERIRALGISIAIDDFGTGYSSLSYLHRLPVDRLKIDRSFVRDINNAAAGTASVVRAIVVMAHSLDLSVVAEGVETDEQLEAIREAGCDFAQGYYYHRPLSVDATEQLLAVSSRAEDRQDVMENTSA
jgi:diguanylate cyclase (GGDEF)-like protein